MKLAHIAPTAALCTDTFKNLDFHLCLASQVLEDPIYMSYFRDAKGHVMMDVPTREEKKPEPYAIEKLIQAVQLVSPSEITLPDIWGGDVEANIDAAEFAAYQFGTDFQTKRGTLGFLICPRGKNWEEYRDCAIRMAKIPGVVTVGVVVDTHERFPFKREEVVQEFRRLFPHLNIHLLGVMDDLSDISNPIIRKYVRSADTAKLVRFGFEHKLAVYGNVPTYPHRGEKYFERSVSEMDLAYISRNIRYWNVLVRK